MGLADSKQGNPSISSPPANGMADTPDLLADVAIRVVGTAGASSWLDPSAGSGQLVGAALRAGVSADSILAIDLQTYLPALERLGIESLVGTDFLRWAQHTERRFDRLVANPPFVPLHELQEPLFRAAIDTRLDGIGMSARANYWVAFLLAGMRLLKPGGALAFILPAAWEYADYASPIRELCAKSFAEMDVHRVSVPMFTKVSDGAVLLVGRGYGKQRHRDVRVIRHSTLSSLNDAVHSSVSPSTNLGEIRQQEICLQDDQIRLGQIAEIRIGAVTGDARYFLFSEEQRIRLGIPTSAVRPILSKAGHITSAEVNHDAWVRLLDAGKRVWLFYPSDTDLLSPSVRTYVDLPLEDGGCHRGATKITNRRPWYRVTLPRPFDGFATGMSQATPWVALNLMPNLTISNTLYGIRFPTIRNVDEQAAWCLSMLSTTSAQSRAKLVRKYPQGLLKLEPRDLAALPIRRPKSTEHARALYRKAVDLIASGRGEAAQAMVDAWLD